MASAPGPPPSTREHGHTGVASVRLRRTSAIKSGESAKAAAGASASNQEAANNAGRGRANRQETRRDRLFTFQNPRRGQLESSVTIAVLQENLRTLTALSQREKALSASLKQEVSRLTEALAKLNEKQESEKVEHEKNAALQTTQKVERQGDPCFLPDIHGASTLAAATAALQQHTQMEVLSLENRCSHMTENNKKLLTKIQQLENAQTEAHAQLQVLQQDNARLETETEDLNSTITSQTSLIIGLRSTVQRLNSDAKLVESFRKNLVRCQGDLDAVKKRERLLQEEYAKFKVTSSNEKEAMMSKILGFQQHLQRNDTANGNVTALETKIRTLMKEKEALEVQLEASNSRCGDLHTRVAQLDNLSEEFVQVKRKMEKEKHDVEVELANTQQELENCIQRQKETEERAQEAEARNAGMQELTDTLQTRDEEIATLMQKVIKLEDDVEERDQRYTGLQDELHKVNTELQNLKQLSHDETVQALQMARQKAATYEALTLLNEEKKALEEQLRLVQEQLEAERVALHEEKDAREHMVAVLEAHVLTIDELRKENNALLEQIHITHMAAKDTAAFGTQTVEELVSPETHADTPNELEAARAELEQAKTELEEAKTELEEAKTELEEANSELEDLRSQVEELQQKYDGLQKNNEDLKENQGQMELGYKRTVSRERYKSESFQSQLRLLQNENGELSEKMETLCKELTKEQQLNDAQTLEMNDLRQRVLSREAIYLLRKTQDSLEQTVNSLLEAEHASESTFTCLQCMQLFTQPMTLAPCGHTYCAACLAKCGNVDIPSSITCKMCESGVKKETECIFPNYALADLTARFTFRQQSLASLTTMCLSLRNSFTQRGPNSKSTTKLSET
ncbi:hypothetical protein PHYSODRAFT_326395 [Phytophthora sojae]|uniref:RING-type domain-containing protein n=1 Tax=Phytophthora sojae (strain P6497) TaxID=1094619 RepID=G4YSE1_PHYSP|nr:hypothetical protein PHYSODRAFT_326395 [Phytophthora sojae]EGZ25372.1 hypothetical protein PHYSODRAFT_326395 [Phytophthora sojae]|eukprot:XP_009520660.1 hypothetical protein PHYSODRAFT_326395 [Phytophthora sojae]